MIRFLPYALELFLVVFCLIDCIQSDEGSIRNWAGCGGCCSSCSSR